MFLGDIRDNGNETRPSDPSLIAASQRNRGRDIYNNPMSEKSEPSLPPVERVNSRFEGLRHSLESIREELHSGVRDLEEQRMRIDEESEMHHKRIAMLNDERNINYNRIEALHYALKMLTPLQFHTDPQMYSPTEKDVEVPLRQNFGTLEDAPMAGMSHPSNRY